MYLLLRSGTALTRVVPLSVMYAAASFYGRIAGTVPSGSRRAAASNIGRVLQCPPTSRKVRRAVRRVFTCQALNYVDLMRMRRLTRQTFDQSVVLGDMSPVHNAVAAGKGAIILSAHLGNMDLALQYLCINDIKVHGAMEHLSPQRLHAYVVHQRTVFGLTVHELGSHVMSELTQALRAGEVVGLVADRDFDGNGQTVSFFGRPALLPAGPVMLALRTGAPLVPAFARRLKDKRIAIELLPPVYLERHGSLRDDLAAGMATMASILEKAIGAAPDQWVVFSPIWSPEMNVLQAVA